MTHTMTDAEHAAVLRRHLNGDAQTLVEMRAAIERAIELLERKAVYTVEIDPEQWADLMEQYNRMTR